MTPVVPPSYTKEFIVLPDGREAIVYLWDAYGDPIVFGWTVWCGGRVAREGMCGTKDEARRETRNVVEALKANPPAPDNGLRRRLEKSWGWL